MTKEQFKTLEIKPRHKWTSEERSSYFAYITAQMNTSRSKVSPERRARAKTLRAKYAYHGF